jgi:hypothetical protein
MDRPQGALAHHLPGALPEGFAGFGLGHQSVGFGAA